MSEDLEEIKRLLYKSLADNTSKDHEIDKRVSTLELIVKSHMEWEEKNYDDIKDILRVQQSSIAQIADKLQVSNDHINVCKTDLRREIDNTFVTKKDLQLALVEMGKLVDNSTEDSRKLYQSNKDEINKAKYILYGIGLVMVAIQFIINNVPKVEALTQNNQPTHYHSEVLKKND